MHTGDELEILSQGFDQMAGAVQDKVEALELPAFPLHYHGKETAYMPGIHRIFQSNLRRQVTHMLRYNLFIYLRKKQCKRLRNLQHILSEVGKHLIPAPC